MKLCRVNSAAGVSTLAAAAFLWLGSATVTPAGAQQGQEETAPMAEVEAATQYARDWLNGELSDAEYNMPEITYDGDPITLRWSHHVPETSTLANIFKPGFRLLEKLSQGKLEFDERWGGTVHPAQQGFDAIRSGLTDMTACYIFYDPRSYDLMHILALPGIIPSSTVGTRITHEVYSEFFRDEFERTGALMGIVYNTTPYVPVSKTPIESLDDLKGAKVRTGGGVHADVWEKLGAVPTTMPSPQIYTAFQRGLLDAVTFPDATHKLFRVDELAKAHTYINLSRLNQEHCVSPQFYNDLPTDLQEVMSRWLQGMSQLLAQEFYIYEGAKSRHGFEEQGIEMVQLSEEEKERWQELAEPVIDQWVKDMEAKGLPAQRLLDMVQEKAEEYRSLTPKEVMELTLQEPVSDYVGGS